MNLEHLAWLAWHRGEGGSARRLGADAVEHYRACAHPASIAAGLESLARFLVADDPQGAAQLLGTAAWARSTTGEPRAPVHEPAWRATHDAARDALGEERFAAAFAAGERDATGTSQR